MASKTKSEKPLKKGGLSDQEKSQIETLVKYENWATIAKKLNRDPSTIRKYCQRQGLTKDHTSIAKNIDEKKKKSPYFDEMQNILTEREMDIASKIYTELMKQFGTDILPSEEYQVVDFCIVSMLLNRALAREKEILRLTDMFLKEKELHEKLRATLTEEDEQQDWYEKSDNIDMNLGALSDELKNVKKYQMDLLARKDGALKSMNATREARQDEISKANESWGDFIYYLKKNPDFRSHLGYEIEKFRLGLKEEFIRLSTLHEYADGEFEHPILNADVVMMQHDGD